MIAKLKSLVWRILIAAMNKRQYIKYLRKIGVTIGEGCDIHKSAFFGSEPWLVNIGNNVRITKNVQFITHDGGLWTLRKMGLIDNLSVKYGKIQIGDNCNISWNVTIMPNVKIGKNTVIAAGALVTKDVPEGTVFGGVPAKHIETIEEYYQKIHNYTVPTFGMSDSEKKAYLLNHCPEFLEESI